MDALFTAVDITDVSTNVSTLLIAFIGINLLFLGYKYVRKVMGRA
jgi:glycopeptide antibiotics resistance protein